MKKQLCIILTLSLLIILAACGSASQTTTLYAVLNAGDADGNGAIINEYPLSYEGDLTVEVLAKGLSDLTGYNFNAKSLAGSEIFTVDWAMDSSIFTDLSADQPKDEFMLDSPNDIRWFMLDSLWLSVSKNLNQSQISFTMNGGLPFDAGLYPLTSFVPNQPYLGSHIYRQSASAANTGINQTDSGQIAAMVGNWYDQEGNYYQIDEYGNAFYYNAAGELLSTKTIDYIGDTYQLSGEQSSDPIAINDDDSFTITLSGSTYSRNGNQANQLAEQETSPNQGQMQAPPSHIVGQWEDAYHDIILSLNADSSYQFVPQGALSFFDIPDQGSYTVDDDKVVLHAPGEQNIYNYAYLVFTLITENETVDMLDADGISYTFIKAEDIITDDDIIDDNSPFAEADYLNANQDNNQNADIGGSSFFIDNAIGSSLVANGERHYLPTGGYHIAADDSSGATYARLPVDYSLNILSDQIVYNTRELNFEVNVYFAAEDIPVTSSPYHYNWRWDFYDYQTGYLLPTEDSYITTEESGWLTYEYSIPHQGDIEPISITYSREDNFHVGDDYLVSSFKFSIIMPDNYHNLVFAAMPRHASYDEYLNSTAQMAEATIGLTIDDVAAHTAVYDALYCLLP